MQPRLPRSRRQAATRADAPQQLEDVPGRFLTHVHSTPFFSLQVMRVIVHRLRKEMYGDDGAGPA